MHQRKLAIGLLLAASTVAFATLITTYRVNGTGRALDSTGHRGYFSVDATKVVHNDTTTLRGTFDFTLPGPTDADSLRVHLNSVEGMNVSINQGAIGGPGVLRIQHGTEVHYYFGRVYFLAASNRHLNEDGPMDGITVIFVPGTKGDPSFRFDGVVPEGDVEVSTNLSY